MTEPVIAATEPAVLELEPGTYYWCACGRSKNKPFCDGSHEGSEFSPQVVEITGKQTVVLCQCKQTKTPPFCDGSHNEL
ncbi:MAG: CDGSH iron-sulfur domain-containing protein [Mariprofundus sp.]|nr:CDGSH iron-sulfur domain-containing protein [Mariprofundus sp.]